VICRILWKEIFRIGSQSVGDTVDVIEIRDNLYEIVDGTIVEATGPQSLDIRGTHVLRTGCQLLREFQ